MLSPPPALCRDQGDQVGARSRPPQWAWLTSSPAQNVRAHAGATEDRGRLRPDSEGGSKSDLGRTQTASPSRGNSKCSSGGPRNRSGTVPPQSICLSGRSLSRPSTPRMAAGRADFPAWLRRHVGAAVTTRPGSGDCADCVNMLSWGPHPLHPSIRWRAPRMDAAGASTLLLLRLSARCCQRAAVRARRGPAHCDREHPDVTAPTCSAGAVSRSSSVSLSRRGARGRINPIPRRALTHSTATLGRSATTLGQCRDFPPAGQGP